MRPGRIAAWLLLLLIPGVEAACANSPREVSPWRVGFFVGGRAPGDDRAAPYDAGGATGLQESLEASPALYERIAEGLGGAFVIGGEPSSFERTGEILFGLSFERALAERWRVGLALSSSKGRADARFPVQLETSEGPATREGSLRTDLRAIGIEALARRRFDGERMQAFLGGGAHATRVTTEETIAELGGEEFTADEPDPRWEWGPLLSVGLVFPLSERIALSVESFATAARVERPAGDTAWPTDVSVRAELQIPLLFAGGTTVPPEETEPPRVPPPPIPPPEGEPDRCEFADSIHAGAGIQAELLHPEEREWAQLPQGGIPLVATATDLDDLVQTCTCLDDEGVSEKRIEIVDPVRYEWVVEEGNGYLSSTDGPSTIYHVPTLLVGEEDRATIRCVVRDGRGNDDPVDTRVYLRTTRDEGCGYERESVVLDAFPTWGRLTARRPDASACPPVEEEWTVWPNPSTSVDAPGRLCVGQLRLCRATTLLTDDDTVLLQCTGECGDAGGERKLPDETVVEWTARRGTFAGDRGTYWETVTTRGRRSTAVYRAPEEAGRDTIVVKIRDSGLQAVDPEQTITRAIEIGRVDLAVVEEPTAAHGGVADPWEECGGAETVWNEDGDVEEEELLEIRLDRAPRTGSVTLSKSELSRGKIRVWNDRRGRREVRLPKEYAASRLPKRLWVEGTAPSAGLRDVRLRLLGDDGCADEVAVTVVPWCADDDEDCGWTILTQKEAGQDVTEWLTDFTVDCSAHDLTGFAVCMRDFFEEHPDCCCIMHLAIVGHGTACSDDPDHCDRCLPGASGLGGGEESFGPEYDKLWDRFLCDDGTIEWRKCNGWSESFFWEVAVRLGAGREVTTYKEKINPFSYPLADGATFRVPEDALPGDEEALRRLADCLTDPTKGAAERAACERAWRNRAR
ncbi:MAG: hypothetical protein GF346_12510 [Candidatus Eisenbacteria bacterium]|nr:hypothetical protein [Candidatus Latescibacterota bacterium]MBD3303259.1 hypothetical protein [Candidatus Eisenbacteria bacterium]